MKTEGYKAVFIDLDGTLLNRKAQVSDRNAACLKKLIQQGVHVVIATGRPVESVRQLVHHIESPDPVISLSGSMIHKSLFGEPLASHIIPFETMHSVLEACRGLSGIRNILLDESDGFYALRDDPALEEFIGMYKKKPKSFGFDDVPSGPVLSMLIHADENRRWIYEFLQQQFSDLVHFTYFREYPWIELSAFEANKGQAMRLVCEALQVDIKDVIAIGDAANDLEMIAAAGLGVAMDNADEEIKAIADSFAPRHDQDGVAAFLEQVFAHYPESSPA